jgi:serine/threonine protein kinase
MLKLHVVEGPDKGAYYPVGESFTLLLGRSRHSDTRLKDMSVSRVHAEVECKGKRVTVTDLESQSGTYLNGKRISEGDMKIGDVLRIGDTQLKLEGDHIAEQETLPPPPEKPPLLPAQRLSELTGKHLSHFKVGIVLAKGQSGLVFKATDFKTDKDVALKVLWPEFSTVDEDMRRFVRAMKTMLPLKHPNLVQLLGAGKTGPYCWVSMEYVEGESLTQMIQRMGPAGMLDWRHALRVATHVGRALEYAHGQNVVHRNITPQNILIQTTDKLVKLGDLMLAKAQEGTLAQQITKPGELLGEIRYMSPERTSGSVHLDARSDIYSLGATVYMMLTGKPPCEGASLIDTIQKIRNEVPLKPKKFQLSIPDMFEGAVMRMLAKAPEARFQSATDLLKDLDRVAKYQGVQV